ncbi:MAG: PA14 domain-containing protein, partial [Phycisphaerae bacterium]
DGSDVRVATGDGREVSSRVLMTGPGDKLRVAFAIRPGIKQYYVYFGHDDPPARDEELEIKRGVLMESWEYPGGQANNLKQARAVLKKADKLIGRDIRDRIFIGHNPFGPQAAVVSRFTGWLLCPVDGEYTFSCSSSNASFLLIDGVLLIDNGRWHAPQRDIRKRDRVKLKAGLHKLEFLHVNPWGNPVAVVAWKPPNHRRVTYIPPGAYAPFRQATPGMMEKYGQSIAVDFLPVHAGETFMQNRYYQRYVFQGFGKGRAVRASKLKWDFGDGQTAEGEQVQHVYLSPGLHKVTCTAKTFGREVKRTHKVFVSRPWDRVTENKLDGVKEYAGFVARYDFAKLPARANAEAMLLLDRGGQTAAMLAAGAALLQREKIPGGAAKLAMPAYVEAMSAAGKELQAAEDLLTAAKASSTPDAAARFMVGAGRILLNRGKITDALNVFESAVRKYAPLTTDPAVREARIGIGDVWRAGGHRDKAAAAYDKAGPQPRDRNKKPAVEKGDFARHVEAYLLKRKYDDAETYLRRWELAYPMDKLGGYWSRMAVELYLRQKRYAEAVLEAEVLVRVNPGSNYAARLLLYAHDAYRMLEKPKLARGALQRIVKEYAESPLSEEAARMLSE